MKKETFLTNFIYSLRVTTITALIAAIFIFLVKICQLNDGRLITAEQWSNFPWASALRSLAIACIGAFIFTFGYHTKWTKMRDALSIDEGGPLPLGLFITVIWALFTGLSLNYSWIINWLTADSTQWIAIGLAFIAGLCGRGFALAHVILTIGICATVTAWPNDVVVLMILIGGPALIGYIVNRIYYFIFVKEHSFMKSA